MDDLKYDRIAEREALARTARQETWHRIGLSATEAYRASVIVVNGKIVKSRIGDSFAVIDNKVVLLPKALPPRPTGGVMEALAAFMAAAKKEGWV